MWNLWVIMKFGCKFIIKEKLLYVLCLFKLDNIVVVMNNKNIKYYVFVYLLMY